MLQILTNYNLIIPFTRNSPLGNFWVAGFESELNIQKFEKLQNSEIENLVKTLKYFFNVRINCE